MSKTDDKFNKYLGYKFFRKVEGSDNKFDIVRIVKILEFNNKFVIENRDTKRQSIISHGDLKSHYTPLEPKGFMMVTEVWVGTDIATRTKDVIISLYDMFRFKTMEDPIPYCICRQSVTDFFYDTIRTNPYQEVVGVCVSQDTCPPNIPYQMMLTCDGLIKSQFVNYYMDDTIDNILECLDTDYDQALEECFISHMKSFVPLFDISSCELKQHNGWCRNLRTLLTENSFITDLDSIRNIQALDFDLSKHIINESEDSTIVDEDVRIFLCRTFKIPIIKGYIITFDYDIDMSQFQNDAYMFFRDNTDTLYLVVYETQGKYLEAELEEEYNKKSISDEIRLAFYNKYANYDTKKLN